MGNLYPVISDLYFFKYRFRLITRKSFSLPAYPGSTIRGALGWAIRKTSCPEGLWEEDCKNCNHLETCVYPFLFKTLSKPEHRGFMRKYENPPPPFIISIPTHTKTVYKKDDPLSFELTLFGEANKFLPIFLLAVQRMAEDGLGSERGNLEVLALDALYEDGSFMEIYTPERNKLTNANNKYAFDTFLSFSFPCDLVILRFLTPLRLHFADQQEETSSENRKRIVDFPPPFSLLITRILERTVLIARYYCEAESENDPDFSDLVRQTEAVKILRSQLELVSFHRETLKGLLGSIAYSGELTPFLPLLKAGEHIHIGKATSFGLGKYILDARRKPA